MDDKKMVFPLTAVHDKERTARELEEARKRLHDLSLEELNELLKRVKYVNEGVSDAQPWIEVVEFEIALRKRINRGE